MKRPNNRNFCAIFILTIKSSNRNHILVIACFIIGHRVRFNFETSLKTTKDK